MLPDERLQLLLASKDPTAAMVWCTDHGYSESWSIIDGALVIFDCDDPPVWLAPVIRAQDEDGNTNDRTVHAVSWDVETGVPTTIEYGVGTAITGAPVPS